MNTINKLIETDEYELNTTHIGSSFDDFLNVNFTQEEIASIETNAKLLEKEIDSHKNKV